MQEVVSSFEGHQGWRESRASSATMRPQSEDPWPLKGRVPGEKETSLEQSLANVREAHQKALATAAALEEEIERLSHPLFQRQPEVRGSYGRSKDCRAYGSTECKKRCHQVSFSDTLTTHPLTKENMGSVGEELAPEDLDLGKPLELEPGITSFLTRSVESSEEEESPPEPPVGELHRWVMWKAEATEIPDWWRELLALLGVPDCKKLPQQIWASFSHPRRAAEIKEMIYHCHAPPAPPCLLQDCFLLPHSTIFACRDVWEVWREKTIAYACALQYWAEKSNLLTGGQPCWLAESVKELREEMRCYLSFTDHKVFEGMIPPEETIPDPVKESHLASKMDTIVNVPKNSATRETLLELAQERKCPKFPRWEKVLYPSWPMAVIGKPPCPSRSPEQTYPLDATCNQPTRKHLSRPPLLHRDWRLLVNGSLLPVSWM